MGKRGGGTWKIVLVEVGVALLAVLGKEIANRASEYMDERAEKRKEKAQKEAEESKTEGENGTS